MRFLSKFTLVFLTFILSFAIISVPSHNTENIRYVNAHTSNGYTPVTNTSLFIRNDSEFITYGFPGNGSAENPYRIENYTLSFQFNSTTVGILVENVTKHFVIRNITLTNNVSENLGTGIKILANNGTVEKVTVNNVMNGLHLEGTDLRVEDSVFHSEQFGIWSKESYSLQLINTNVTSAYYGIYLRSCDQVNIKNNTILYGHYGIQMYECTNFRIEYNMIQQSSEIGLFIVESFPTTGTMNLVARNKFIQNEIQALIISSDINTIFYDEVSQEGNYWSDWRKWGNYEVQKGIYDFYPLGPSLEQVSKYPFKFWFWIFAPTLIVLGVTAYFFYWKLVIQPTKE